MRAAYIQNQIFATSSLHFMLCEVFGEANVMPLKLSELRPSSFRGLDFFLMPGIAKEKSPYPDMMSGPTAEMVYRKMEDDGMIAWDDCAAGYWDKNYMVYTDKDGSVRTRKGLGWIDGTARGPLPNRGAPVAKAGTYLDTTTVGIEYYVDGDTCETDIAYSNGGGFYLSEEEINNPLVEIHARYKESDRPIAAMTKKIGHGILASLGVLPQIKPAYIDGRFTDPVHELHRVQLFNRLAQHENGIRHFQDDMFKKIFDHVQKWPQSSYPERLYA